MTGQPPIRVVVLAGVRLYAEGIAECLQRTPHFYVLGSASSAAGAVARCGAVAPDVCLIDVAMRDGVDVLLELSRSFPDAHHVALGVSSSFEEVIEFARLGVGGFVQREATLADLRDAVQGVLEGKLVCPPRLARELMHGLSVAPGRPEPTPLPLTPRELEILRLLDLGLSNKEIARRLYIGLSTVKNHVHNLLSKLKVESRGQAAALLRRGPRPLAERGS